MSTDDKKDQDARSRSELPEEDHQTASTPAEGNDLKLLGSPFAYTPAPADLIDLWDETDRFFDALGDPHEFIEPEGDPTYQVNYSATLEQEQINDRDPLKEPVKLFEVSSTKDDEVKNLTSSAATSAKANSSTEDVFQEGQSTPSTGSYPPRVPEPKQERAKEPSRPSLAERFTQRHRPETTVIVIAGGKGGVGRSLLAANLSLSLAHLTKDSVGIVDLDPVGANLHTYLGLEPVLEMPGKTLRGEVKPISQKIPQSEVILTRSGRALYGISQDKEREGVLSEALSLKPKWLIVDAGHLPDPFTLNLFTSANFSLTVYTPDPSSVERGHHFLQAALYSQLIDQGDEASVIARSLLTADHEGVVAGPRSLARSLRHVHAAACRSLEQRINHFTPHIIVNQCRTQSDRATSEMICSVLKRKWSVTPVALGSVSFHHVAQQSLIERRPIRHLFPSAPTCLDIEKITRSLIKLEATSGKSHSEQLDSGA